jgi:uncharacterized protein YeaO (DUF488 family)
MAVQVVRLGTPRVKREGLRLGTVRRLPRGVKKTDYASRDYFDVWLPELAPSNRLLSWALAEEWTPARWAAFSRRYRREMRQPSAARLLALLAAMSATTDFSVGCYCADPDRCHRTVLRELLAEAGAAIRPPR